MQELLERRKDLKLILMSATLQADLFQNYFGNCPAIHVPGRTFPVRHIFLEDIESKLASVKSIPGMGYSAGGGGRGGGGGGRGGGRDGGKGGGGGRGGGGGGRGGGFGGRDQKKGRSGNLNGSGNGNGGGPVGPPIISPKAEDPIDYILILNLLTLLVTMREADDSEVGGAVLVFFSGFQEIYELCKMIGTHPVLGNPNRVQAFPLHSSLPSDAQRAVFRRMPKGVTKVCLSCVFFNFFPSCA